MIRQPGFSPSKAGEITVPAATFTQMQTLEHGASFLAPAPGDHQEPYNPKPAQTAKHLLLTAPADAWQRKRRPTKPPFLNNALELYMNPFFPVDPHQKNHSTETKLRTHGKPHPR